MPNSGENYNSQTEGESEEEVEYEEVDVEEEIDEDGEEEVEYEEVEVEEEIEEDEEEIEEEEEAIVENDEDAEDEEKTNGTSKGLDSYEYAKDLDFIKSTPEGSKSIFAHTSKEVTDSANDKEAPYSSVTNVLDKYTSEASNHEKEIVENQTFDKNVQQVKKLSPHEVNVLDKHTSSNESGCSETSNHEKEIMQNQTSDENVQEEKHLSSQEVNVLDKHISLMESGCSETSNHKKEIVGNQSPDENVKQVKTTLSPKEVNDEGSTEKSMMEVDSTVGKKGKILANLNVSSMLVPQKRPRSSTPLNELENSSKKNAVICDFFARGWCIKGNSCPFLHQKERNKETIAEPSRKEDFLDGSGCHGESKSMSLSPQEKPNPSKPLLQAQTNEHIIAGDRIPKREPYNASPLLRRCSYSPPVRDLAVNDRCYFNGTPLPSSNYLNNSCYSLDPMNSRNNGFDKGYQSSGSSSLPKDPSSFLLKFTKKPSNFPARLWRKIESEETLWQTSTPFAPTYPSIIAQLYPHKKLYDSQNVLTSTNVLNGTTKNVSQNFDASAFAHESYGQSSGAKPLLPKEEKYVSTHNSIDVASANNDNGVTSANIVGLAAQGQNSNLKHGGGDMEVDSRESKEMKAFRVALIEFVKELVKPFWHEGRLTKDAHKKVVKKSVEKVICSFEAYQIPSESESIDQYLSVNRPKLLKLVEAYVAKYSIA